MNRLITHRWFHFTLLSLMVIAAAIFNMDTRTWRKEINYFVFDAYNAAYPRPRTDDILIVDIDDASLEQLGQWPWPRTVLARWVDNLSAMGARVIVFDGVLAEPDRSSPQTLLQYIPDEDSFAPLRPMIANLKDHDAILAESIANSGVFVAGFTYSTQTQSPRQPRLAQRILIKRDDAKSFLANSKHFQSAAVFLPVLESAAAGNGSFMASPDHDGIIRQTHLLYSHNGTLYPSLSLEALRVGFAGKSLIKIAPRDDDRHEKLDTDYRIVIGDMFKIPVNPDGLLNVYYRHFDKTRDYISAVDTIQNTSAAPDVSGKIVLIGSSAEGLKDLRSTAIDPFIPGVEVHANVIEQALQGEYLLRPDIVIAVEALVLLCAGILIVLFAPFVHVGALGFFCACIIGALFTGGTAAYTQFGLMLDPLYASVCLFLLFVTSTILSYIRSEGERQHIRDAFGFYISKEYMRELTENPDKLKLGGDLRELTVMFTDIRNFTTISEDLSPTELIQLMNDFLTPMSDLVMTHKGTIDKYNGDAMMAFWNAPLEVADHPRHACTAALKMQDALEPINTMVEERAIARGKTPTLLRAGIGLNTGDCAVGNMGSKQRFAYSALGDAVNVAARLEGQTKHYGVGILIGEKTWKAVPDFATLEADLIQVKGKTKPERIFILLGDDALQNDPDFQDFSLLHASFIDIYRSGDFKRARDILKTLQANPKFDVDTLYDLYAERIKAMKTPPKDWNGVYVATEK